MKKYLFFAVLVALVWACGGAAGATETPDTGAGKVAAAPDGQRIYKTYCVTCHGLYGDMGASGAFNLQTSALDLEARILVIAKGRNAMTPFENLLSPEQIAAVAEYTLTLAKDPK